VAVAVRGETLTFSGDADPEFVSLAKQCMSVNPADRPTFPVVAKGLEAMRCRFAGIAVA
jgi:hypothetical protein